MYPSNPREEIYLLVAYDIVKDRRRDRVAKYLSTRLERRQKSLFEGWLPPYLLDGLVEKLRELMEEKTDTIRVFRLCKRCRKDGVVLGRPLPLVRRDYGRIL